MQNEVSGVLSDSRVFRMLKKKKKKGKKKGKKTKAGRKGRRKEKKAKNRPTKAPLPERQLNWLLGYPGSGSDELLSMVEASSHRSHATNYGNELFYKDDSRYRNGPFKNNENMGTDIELYDGTNWPLQVLVKTYCVGYCLEENGKYCHVKSYMKNLLNKSSRFSEGCAKGMTYNAKRGRTLETRPYTKEEKVKGVIVMIRNPVTMLGARMIKGFGDEPLENWRINHGVFIDYCAMIDKKYSRAKEIRKQSTLIKDAAKGVPCYTEFLRIALWYKNVYELFLKKDNRLIVRWEDLYAHDVHWINEVAKHFDMAYVSDRNWKFDASAETKNNHDLISLTTPEEYEKIMAYIKAIVSPQEWHDLYEVYADKHPRSFPKSMKDFLHVKNFYWHTDSSDGYIATKHGNLEECTLACQEDMNCKSFNFHHDYLGCNLMSVKPEYDELVSTDEKIDHYTAIINHQHLHLDPDSISDDDDDDYYYYSPYGYRNDDDNSYNGYNYQNYGNSFGDDGNITDDTVLAKQAEMEARQKVEEYYGTVHECQKQCFMLSWCKSFDYNKDEKKCMLRGKHGRRSQLTRNDGNQDHYSMVYDPRLEFAQADNGVKRCEEIGMTPILDVKECGAALLRLGRIRSFDVRNVALVFEERGKYGCSYGHVSYDGNDYYGGQVNTAIAATEGSDHNRSPIICYDGPY
eukprot:CAMPEP_0172492364 /NCGR_PEP_ID=MMETSP1066-20121228/23498_1 /TAXON_ID=671091 /ORGANISM="Coscinodiscus wailesii, Strain CCMP2513" /LENGTH=685 /DNA_ID=CAMNT_0013261949 /DNA_START=220 /DNA_END=2277 /DNA_ORIENTATION=+